MDIEDILKYWTLCELSDFETFKLPNKMIREFSYLEKLKIIHNYGNQDSIISKEANTEYIYSKNQIEKTYINIDKKTTIYKAYLGLIKVEDFIKFLNHNNSNSVLNEFDSDLQNINTEEYTYVGYIYLDYLGNIIKIENTSIVYNPIFYILKNLTKTRELNNFNFNIFLEEKNIDFSKKYSIENKNTNYIIPSFHYLMKSITPYKNSNPFKFLEHENSKILIFNDLVHHIIEIATMEDNNEYKEKAIIYKDYLCDVLCEKIENDNIKFCNIENDSETIEEYLLHAAKLFSLKNSSSYIIYLINKEHKLEQDEIIPSNMYLFEFLKKENINTNITSKTNKKDIDFYQIQEETLNLFNIDSNILYKDDSGNSIFIGIENQEIPIANVKNIIENQMISFYIDSLGETPKLLTLDYLKGKTHRIDVNFSIQNRKDINKLEYFKENKGKWVSKYPLYYAQQCAVNLFNYNYNKKGNIFSVNGSPGTGKTTLLKDVVANINIKRTHEVLNLDGNIFSENLLNENLVGKYEIIVTSNNNTAVQNITIELPKIKEFDFEYIGYSKNDLLLNEFATKFYDFESWGLISLNLGKKANAENFRRAFKDLVDEVKQTNKLTNKAFLDARLQQLKNDFYTILKNIEKDESEFEFYDWHTKDFSTDEYYLSNDDYFNQPENILQKEIQLYGKKTYLKNKAKLFFISVQITEIVFLKNIDSFSLSINYFLDNYSKKDLIEKDLLKLRISFSSLFYLFPVVSTTLASSYTMLRNINSFGALICDESGQATPQSLVGVLNRANNALIVGDPLQVEPVFTTPDLLIRIYNEAFNVPSLYSPLNSSAQSIADNANIYGSYYEIKNQKIWVGMPLVVHRRCLNPMFDISNKISYNDKMIFATEYPSNEIDELPNSCWIDIESHDDDFIGNTSKKEIKFVTDFIRDNSNIINKNYYIISPFKSIYKVFNNKENATENKPFGTVHTFQGKEAEIVFIVLGGKSLGAKSWAAQKPNILNVALTRAKKRVYIIGDIEKWSKMNYFNEAAKILKSYNYKTFKADIEKEKTLERINLDDESSFCLKVSNNLLYELKNLLNLKIKNEQEDGSRIIGIIKYTLYVIMKRFNDDIIKEKIEKNTNENIKTKLKEINNIHINCSLEIKNYELKYGMYKKIDDKETSSFHSERFLKFLSNMESKILDEIEKLKKH